MSRERRRHYMVDQSFQLNFIFKFCLVTIISSLAIGSLVYYFSQSSTTVAIEHTKVIVKPTSDFIRPLLILTVLIVTVFSAVVVLFLTLIVSHRIAGPVYRFRKDLARISEGYFENPFQIRRKDQLRELAESLKTMTNTFKWKVVFLQQANRRLNSLLHHEGSLSPENLKQVRDVVRQINEEISFFKIK